MESIEKLQAEITSLQNAMEKAYEVKELITALYRTCTAQYAQIEEDFNALIELEGKLVGAGKLDQAGAAISE